MSAKGPNELNMLTKAQANSIGIAVNIYDAGSIDCEQDVADAAS
jgi:hypothetical protein